MIKASVLFSITLLLSFSLSAQTAGGPAKAVKFPFDDYFIAKTLRIDYYMAGDDKVQEIYLKEMKQEPNYGGSHSQVMDPFDYGSFRYCAYDSATGDMIYSRGFCNLFQEWRGTPEAKNVKRAFQQTAVLPFPKKTIRFEIDRRAYEDGKWVNMFHIYIRPDDYFINRENIHPYKYVKLRDSGPPEKKLDIAFLAEGYTKKEMKKFLKDAKGMMEYFLSQQPYSDLKDNISFWAVESPSDEPGVTIPGKGTYVNTDINSSFYTFDMDRYMTSFNTKAIYDIAASVPYDVIFVLVNSPRYGGGGFFNHYGESTVDNPLSKQVAIHEFGHTFAGLADEYYTSSVSYSDFYNLLVEPWEPNITTNVDFGSKWKSNVTPGTPIPTPRTVQYKDLLGMFEGGGYSAKGIYSPMQDCRMKSNEAPGFCPVCRDAIQKMILHYSE